MDKVKKMETKIPETALQAEPADTAADAAEKKIPIKLPAARKKRRWLKILILLAVAAGIVFAGKTYLSRKAGSQTSSDYLVETAQRRDLTISVSGTGTLEPADSYKVTTLISGEIADAPFEEGDLVKKDDLLFSMDASSAQNSVNSAAIGVQQAQLSYQQAQEALNPTATIGGTINEVYVKNGDSVAAGTKLCRIISGDDLYIDFSFPYSAADGFYVGQPASLYLGSFEGTVTGAIASISDASTVTELGLKMKTVRVRLKNPGIVSDSVTAQATIAGESSYGSAQVSLGDSDTVYASGSGTVTGFSKLAGSTVRQGEVLCTVSSDANRKQLENARLATRTAQLSQSTAQDSMDAYRIESPISGTVIEKNFKAGDTVKGMDSGTLAVVYDLSYLKLKMNVDELDIGKVQVGQTVEVTADAVEGQTFTGTVDKVSISGTTTNGVTTYPVTITIQKYGALLPGMNVSARILGETEKNVLCIPVDAVSRGNVVLVPEAGAMNEDNTAVVDDSRVKEQTLTLGRNDEAYIEVTDGLQEGDIVLISNQASSAMDAMMGG